VGERNRGKGEGRRARDRLKIAVEENNGNQWETPEYSTKQPLGVQLWGSQSVTLSLSIEWRGQFLGSPRTIDALPDTIL
jgi:hypothetical protein